MLVMRSYVVVYHGILHESLVVSKYTHEPCSLKMKIQMTSGYSTVYNERALHDCFKPCYRKESDMLIALDGTDVIPSIVYSGLTAFLYSDWV